MVLRSDGRAELADFGFSRLLLSACLIVVTARDHALVHQTFSPREVDARQFALCLGVRELGPLLAGVKFDQDVSLVDTLAGSKAILSILPGRSALTVTPWIATAVPTTLVVAGHFTFWPPRR